MTELEKIRHAKNYLDRLADGIDPISGQAMPEDTVLNSTMANALRTGDLDMVNF